VTWPFVGPSVKQLSRVIGQRQFEPAGGERQHSFASSISHFTTARHFGQWEISKILRPFAGWRPNRGHEKIFVSSYGSFDECLPVVLYHDSA
jgi:hypothetical protein